MRDENSTQGVSCPLWILQISFFSKNFQTRIMNKVLHMKMTKYAL